MKYAWIVLKENIANFYLIRRLSVYEMKSANSNNYLGVLWEIINPIIQIAIYWFVFGFIMRGDGAGRIVEDIDFFPWLLAGIIVWFFVNPGITQASKSIFSRLNMVSKMSFPMSVIPTYIIFAKLYQHLILIIITIIILCFTGFYPSIYLIQLPYFVFATVALLVAFSLISSTLSTIIRDVQMLITSIMRVLFYLTPILWFREDMAEWIMILMKANPLFYIVQGYRASLLNGHWIISENWGYTLYFWLVVIVLFIIGSYLHVKFRNRFVDFK